MQLSFNLHKDLQPIQPVSRQTWSFQVRNEQDEVTVEVVRWTRSMLDSSGRWNYYLLVHPTKLKNPDEWKPKFKPDDGWRVWDYRDSKFNEVYFHGGVTYCQTEILGKNECIKVGCDYSHYDDPANMDAIHGMVFLDATRTAKDFLSFKPFKP